MRKIDDGLTTQQRYYRRHKEKLRLKAKKVHIANPEKRKAIGKRQRAKPDYKDKERNKHYNRKFGITLEQYTEMFKAQNGLCAMCIKPETVNTKSKDTPMWLAVDHDHKTGKVRGLLCFRCNTMLDHFDKDIDKIKAVFAYIKEHQ
jgi:hypothetical protein